MTTATFCPCICHVFPNLYIPAGASHCQRCQAATVPTTQAVIFDLPAGQERKREALERFEHTGAFWLSRARAVAHEHAIANGKVTSDDVLAVVGMPEDMHHNLVGAIFALRDEWRAVGRTATKRAEGHSRRITVWRLR